MKFVAYRLEAGDAPEDGPQWTPHDEWCETPDGLREPLDRDKALELIAWDRQPGSHYRIRSVQPM